MSGALAERDFAHKLQKAGLTDVWIGERIPFGIDHVAMYPLFTPELIEQMRRLISPESHGCVAVSLIARARKPA